MQSASWSLYHNGVTIFIFSTYIPVLLSCHCLIEKCITWQSSINSLLLLYSTDTILIESWLLTVRSKWTLLQIGSSTTIVWKTVRNVKLYVHNYFNRYPRRFVAPSLTVSSQNRPPPAETATSHSTLLLRRCIPTAPLSLPQGGPLPRPPPPRPPPPAEVRPPPEEVSQEDEREDAHRRRGRAPR